MRQRHRYLVAVLAALVLFAPAAFANGGNITPVPYARKGRNFGPYKAKKNIKKSKTMKPAKPMKPMKPYTRSGR